MKKIFYKLFSIAFALGTATSCNKDGFIWDEYGGKIKIHVTDFDTQTGLGKCTITIIHNNVTVVAKETDANGYFISNVLDAGMYQVVISKSGYEWYGDSYNHSSMYNKTDEVVNQGELTDDINITFKHQ